MLTPLAQACGNIHGSPNCGVLTVFPLLFVVPALGVESWLFASPLNTWASWAVFEVVAFAMAVPGLFAVLTIVNVARLT